MSSRISRDRFESFVKQILAVPKTELDARMAEEKKRKKRPVKRPPPAN